MSPDPACIGDTITFTASGVVDEGGIKRVDCVAKTEIPAVTPDYTWELTIPPDYPPPLPPLRGSGPTASVVANGAGTYSCTFTAEANRRVRQGPREPPTASEPFAGNAQTERFLGTFNGPPAMTVRLSCLLNLADRHRPRSEQPGQPVLRSMPFGPVGTGAQPECR